MKFNVFHKMLIKFTAALFLVLAICYAITGKVPAQITKEARTNGTDFTTEFFAATCENHGIDANFDMVDFLMGDLDELLAE